MKCPTQHTWPYSHCCFPVSQEHPLYSVHTVQHTSLESVATGGLESRYWHEKMLHISWYIYAYACILKIYFLGWFKTGRDNGGVGKPGLNCIRNGRLHFHVVSLSHFRSRKVNVEIKLKELAPSSVFAVLSLIHAPNPPINFSSPYRGTDTKESRWVVTELLTERVSMCEGGYWIDGRPISTSTSTIFFFAPIEGHV